MIDKEIAKRFFEEGMGQVNVFPNEGLYGEWEKIFESLYQEIVKEEDEKCSK